MASALRLGHPPASTWSLRLIGLISCMLFPEILLFLPRLLYQN